MIELHVIAGRQLVTLLQLAVQQSVGSDPPQQASCLRTADGVNERRSIADIVLRVLIEGSGGDGQPVARALPGELRLHPQSRLLGGRPLPVIFGCNAEDMVVGLLLIACPTVLSGEIVERVLPGERLLVVMADDNVSGELILRVFLLDEIVQSGLPLRALPRWHLVRSPCRCLTRTAVVIEVVEIAEERHTRVVGEAQGKESGQIAVMGAATSLYVGNPSSVVLFLERHVHDVSLITEFLMEMLAEHARLVIDLYVFHHVGRQVVEHDFMVLGEEEQQTLHILAVDIDASVVLELHARHLSDETVEHASL